MRGTRNGTTVCAGGVLLIGVALVLWFGAGDRPAGLPLTEERSASEAGACGDSFTSES